MYFSIDQTIHSARPQFSCLLFRVILVRILTVDSGEYFELQCGVGTRVGGEDRGAEGIEWTMLLFINYSGLELTRGRQVRICNDLMRSESVSLGWAVRRVKV